MNRRKNNDSTENMASKKTDSVADNTSPGDNGANHSGTVNDMFETPPETVDGSDGRSANETVSKNDTEMRLSEMTDKYLRLLAELDNFRKRSYRDVEMAGQMATVTLMRNLLPILDNLDRATEHRDSETTYEEYVKGVSLIEDQLRQVLADSELAPIEVVGQPFDPNLHEAVMQMESEDFASGTVTQELQKGYRLGDRVIRHSKVIVAK